MIKADERNVEIVPGYDGKLAQQRIAVVALGVDGVAAIGKILPDTVGEKLVMGLHRPVVLMAAGPAFVLAHNLLEEYHIRRHGAHRVAPLMPNETAGGQTEDRV